MAILNDKALLSEIINANEFRDLLKEEIQQYIGGEIQSQLPYPLDDEIVGLVTRLRDTGIANDKTDLPYSKVEDLNTLWTVLITKSIQCLRLFDTREPFKENPTKTIVAYYIDELEKYYKDYVGFESLLYGANAKYRDHILHVFRTWLIGLYVIAKLDFKVNGLDGLEEGWESLGKLTNCEKISMWTIIAFCHDLGYPLEKANEIVSATQSMMQKIVTNSKITADFSFETMQTSRIGHILSFMSTKLKPYEESNSTRKRFNGRIQSKYHYKLTKSLEENNHGVVSAIIIYSILLYFNESDFNLNDDYLYDEEDARQFYIRREILRSIAAHTCPDIYNVNIATFSSLLYICDEIQNWGRKNWHSLYFAQELDESKAEINAFSTKEISYTEYISLEEKAEIKQFVHYMFFRQYDKYKKKFRDGQHSAKRSFDIVNKVVCKKVIPNQVAQPKVEITISIKGNNNKDTFEVKYIGCGVDILSSEDVKGSLFEHEFEAKIEN